MIKITIPNFSTPSKKVEESDFVFFEDGTKMHTL